MAANIIRSTKRIGYFMSCIIKNETYENIYMYLLTRTIYIHASFSILTKYFIGTYQTKLICIYYINCGKDILSTQFAKSPVC